VNHSREWLARRSERVIHFAQQSPVRPGESLRGRAFAQHRDAAIIAVFRAAGIRLAELAAPRLRPSRHVS
jgi:hypothetical protein